MPAPQALKATPRLSSAYAPLTQNDVSAFIAFPRVLLLIGNGCLLGIFAFSCWVLEFKVASIQEIALPTFLLLFVVFNTATGTWLATAVRAAKRGQKVVISGKISRVEPGPVDDDTPVNLVYVEGSPFRIPTAEAASVATGQSIELHYFSYSNDTLGKLLKVQLAEQPDA